MGRVKENEPDLVVMTFTHFEDLNPPLSKRFRLAGWTGPIRVEGEHAYGHPPFVQRDATYRLRWDMTETKTSDSGRYYRDEKGRRWEVDEHGRVVVL